MNFKFLLFTRWIIVNLAASFIMALLYMNGWVSRALVADSTYITISIVFLFLVGLVISGVRVYKTSLELNYIRGGSVGQSKWLPLIRKMVNHDLNSRQVIESLKFKMFSRISIIKWIANSLVLMGLIGTVVGFIIALSGINGDLNTAAAVSGLLSSLISGMGTALYTTLTGSVLYLWTVANYHILVEGSTNLLASILEVEEIPEDE